jgi:Arabinose efflux permease
MQEIPDKARSHASDRLKPLDTSRRWWVLATVVAAQFMFGVDAFIVNVAIPTIAAELHASAAQIEAVIAVYLIAYATLVVTGGRLGDIYGARNVFISGVAGFTVTSLWCGLAQSGPELIAARLAQGATAALMVPQVLATLHLLFADARGPAPSASTASYSGWPARPASCSAASWSRSIWRGSAGVRCSSSMCPLELSSSPRPGKSCRLSAPGRHAAGYSGCDRAVSRPAVPDRPAAVRPRSALVAFDVAGDGRRRRHCRRVPAARARGRPPRRHAVDRSCAAVGCGIHARAYCRVLFLLRQFVVLSGHDDLHAEGAADSAAAGWARLPAAGADLRDRFAP